MYIYIHFPSGTQEIEVHLGSCCLPKIVFKPTALGNEWRTLFQLTSHVPNKGIGKRLEKVPVMGTWKLQNLYDARITKKP